jgi:hypothetical protein
VKEQAPGRTDTASDRVTAAALFLLVCLPRLLFLAQTGITYEDSLITLRYAENLAHGHGLVYNPGERVFGASTPFYVLLLSLLCALRLPDPLLAAKLLCIAADGLTALLGFRLLRAETRVPWAGSLFAVAFALSPLLIQNCVSGMETPVALLWLILAFWADRQDRPALLGLALGLLMLVRPDGAVAAAVLLGVRAVRERRFPVQTAILAAATLLPWLLFAWAYYGTPIPNSLFAKASAYNAHRPSLWPNFQYTLSQFAPYRTTLPQRLFNSLIVVLLISGVYAIVRERRRLLALPLFWLAWWDFLVLPRTLLFLWYYPPLTLSAYLLAGVGWDWMCGCMGVWVCGRPTHRTDRTDPTTPTRPYAHTPTLLPRLLALTAPLYLAACAVPWFRQAAERAALIQRAENEVRRSLGLWLRANTPPGAVVAMEPLGYLGYYSGRRVLDEVGLVSPQMIPFTRAGSGWFGQSMRRFQPDYIVERPYYLERNLTLNTKVPMFAGDEDRAWFAANYEPVTGAATSLALPDKLERDYWFVVYRRR